MGKTTLQYKTKVVTTSDGNATDLFASETLVYSIAIEFHPDSSVTTGWVGASDVTTTNKNGRAFSDTVPVEFKTRWREGSGSTSNLIDASSIHVAAATGADILVTYLIHETT